MKKFLLIQLVLICAIAPFMTVKYGWDAAQSELIGAVFVLVNSALSAWLWGRILEKKYVAIALIGIVSKYAILGAFIYKIVSTPWISTLWFSVGLGHLVVAAVLVALVPSKQSETEEVQTSVEITTNVF